MKYLLFICSLSLLTSCHWAKSKAKASVNKSGEIIGKAGSEFADGISEGVEKTFANEVQLSGSLKKEGLRTGKIIINSTDSTTDNVLSIYFLFDEAINREIAVKVFTEAGQEYGRVRQMVQGTKGEARYVDYVFDKRTQINGKGKVVIE